ncbi:MAG: hypothetical protein GX616_06185 [Planctomycetes bacterium]|nr:hypothetical protein [Planctomycetota bacterium]
MHPSDRVHSPAHWWASGIALGIGVIAVFALFEKKRNGMNALVEQVRKWSD